MTVDWKALPVHLAVERPDLIPARRYYDAEFFELEREHLVLPEDPEAAAIEWHRRVEPMKGSRPWTTSSRD